MTVPARVHGKLGPAKGPKHVPSLQLGIPGVATLQVPLEPGWRAALRRRLLPKPWHERLLAACAQASITISQDDEGDIDVYLVLAHFGRRALVIEQVGVNWLAIANGGLSDTTTNVLGDALIPPRAVSRVHFRIPLGPGGVRQTLHAIGPSPNGIRVHGQVSRCAANAWSPGATGGDSSLSYSTRSLHFSVSRTRRANVQPRETEDAAGCIRAQDESWLLAAARRDLDGMMAIYAPEALLPDMPPAGHPCPPRPARQQRRAWQNR
jgi:hypothetical protein